jgi:hypothetical protein
MKWMQVTVDGPSRTSVNPAGMKQGAACFQYVAMHAGVYTISATIDGRHIANSPATVTASIAKPEAANCEVCTFLVDYVMDYVTLRNLCSHLVVERVGLGHCATAKGRG